MSNPLSLQYRWLYETPSGFDNLVLGSDGDVLQNLVFEESKSLALHPVSGTDKLLPVFCETIRWLDIYFSGGILDFTPEYSICNATSFRTDVIDELLAIPYGSTVSYGSIASQIASKRGIAKMSSRAVGSAVGWNPISIIIPCHRVIGSNGSLKGYGGGLHNKTALLKLEKEHSHNL